MNSIISHHGNGNGQDAVNGRGALRRKLTTEARIALATDIALGLVKITPSIKQAAVAMGVRPVDIRTELKVRAEAMNGITDDTSTKVKAVVHAMPDTPEVRVRLHRLAASLGCTITQFEGVPEPGVDFGPYCLRDETDHDICVGSMPIAGIADALACLARERQLPPDRFGEAWINFGKTWMR